MKKMTERQHKVAEMIRNEVATMIMRGDMNTPNITPMVNVRDVWVSPDLKQARAYFSHLSEQADVVTIQAELNSEAHTFQRGLAKMGLKFTPKIKFFYDETEEKAQRIESLLREKGDVSV